MHCDFEQLKPMLWLESKMDPLNSRIREEFSLLQAPLSSQILEDSKSKSASKNDLCHIETNLYSEFISCRTPTSILNKFLFF